MAATLVGRRFSDAVGLSAMDLGLADHGECTCSEQAA